MIDATLPMVGLPEIKDTSEFYTHFSMSKFVTESDRQYAISKEWCDMKETISKLSRDKELWKISTEFYKVDAERYKKFLDVYDTEEFTEVEWSGKKAISAYLDRLVWEDNHG
jgi:hypothetical protein